MRTKTNIAAASLALPQFSKKIVAPRKGRGSYVRRPRTTRSDA